MRPQAERRAKGTFISACEVLDLLNVGKNRVAYTTSRWPRRSLESACRPGMETLSILSERVKLFTSGNGRTSSWRTTRSRPSGNRKTRCTNQGATKHLRRAFRTHKLFDLTADDIELLLRERRTNATNPPREFGEQHSTRRGSRILGFSISARHTLRASVPLVLRMNGLFNCFDKGILTSSRNIPR